MNEENKKIKIINNICFIFNLIALTINGGCLVWCIMTPLLYEFNDPAGPLVLIIIAVVDALIVVLNILALRKGKIKQSAVFSIIIAIDLFIKDKYIIEPIIGEIEILYNILFPVLIVFEIINIIVQTYHLIVVYDS